MLCDAILIRINSCSIEEFEDCWNDLEVVLMNCIGSEIFFRRVSCLTVQLVDCIGLLVTKSHGVNFM